MDKAKKQELREALLDKKSALKQKLTELKDLSVIDAPDCAVDKVNRENSFHDKLLFEKSIQKTKQQLFEIENALSNIENKDYGICRKCGSEISLKLLLIKPNSQYCIECLKC